MSTSCESTSLKKSRDDCLKLAKQWYSIWVKWCHFWTTAFLAIAICHRASVCLSSVTLVHLTQAIEIFSNVSTPFGTLAICDPSFPTMISRVTAKNVGDVFLKHSVYCSLNTNTVTKWWKTKKLLMSLCCFLFTF